MIDLTDLTDLELKSALDESRYYDPNYDLVDSVRDMLLSKVENNES